MKTYFVYILASQPRGTLYIGVTNDLLGRVEAHRRGKGSRFTGRYGVGRLVHYEIFGDINAAIQREKTLKRYLRDWKINLVEHENPEWSDLYVQLRSLPGNEFQDLSYLVGEAGDGGLVGPRDKPEDDN